MRTLTADEAITVNANEEEVDKQNYHRAVETLCSRTPEDISLYSNPQMWRAWRMCRGLWLRMAACANDICVSGCECDRLREIQEEDSRQQEKEDMAKDFFSSYGIVLDGTEE